MRVFGIDPGSYVTGFGVVEKSGNALSHIDNGIIRPNRSLPFASRLLDIYENIHRLIQKFKPDVVALEDIFVAKNVRGSIILGHVRGIAMLAATASKIKLVEYHPMEVKKAVTGVGNASKHQIQQMVKAILRLPEAACEDASDALAVAICHLNSAALKQLTEN